MKLSVTLTICLLVFSSLSISESNGDLEQKEKTREFVNGTIIEKKFVNKAGKKLDFGELYLRTANQDYFIKLSECPMEKDDLLMLIGEKCKFKVAFKEGLWDTDDPNVQSRIGEYVTILAIL